MYLIPLFAVGIVINSLSCVVSVWVLEMVSPVLVFSLFVGRSCFEVFPCS